MNFEYDYRIGPEGIVFSIIDNFDSGIDFGTSAADKMTIERYVMLAWQEAVNKTSSGPDEIRRLMETEAGQATLRKRAEDYLTKLLAEIPPELDRRSSSHVASNAKTSKLSSERRRQRTRVS